jgi:hypothetical protein
MAYGRRHHPAGCRNPASTTRRIFLDWSEHRRETNHSQDLRKLLPLALVLLPFLPSGNLQAQQTIFNVPSTDVLDKGKVYVELDASLKPTDAELVKKFSSFVPRVVVGAGNHIEVGLNVTGNIQPGPDATTLVPTIKWKPYEIQLLQRLQAGCRRAACAPIWQKSKTRLLLELLLRSPLSSKSIYKFKSPSAPSR